MNTFYSNKLEMDIAIEPDFNLEEVVLETASFMNNPKNFIDQFIRTCLFIENKYKLRLGRWFQFFNNNFYQNPSAIHLTYIVLLEYIDSNELLRTQTQHEFELSLEFYKNVFANKTITLVYNDIYCKKLLSISLIYSKYPGMQTNSFKAALGQLTLHSSNEHFVNLFSTLMVKYQSPKCLLRNIEKLDLIEVAILMHYLSGKNIKQHPLLDFKISNKEQQIMLFEIPMEINITDNVLKKSAAIAKVMQGCEFRYQIVEFFKHNNIFTYRIDDFLDDINFWIKAYNLISNSVNNYSYLGFREYLDYLEYKKREHGKAYQLKGVTPNSLRTAVHEWHEVVNEKIDYNLFKKTWLGTQKETAEIIYDGITYQFSEIRDGKSLFTESNMMQHCVFSYISNCEKGICSIWSLKKMHNTIFKNLLTIEIQNQLILQVKGKHNREPLPYELKIIENWAKENDFIFYSDSI